MDIPTKGVRGFITFVRAVILNVVFLKFVACSGSESKGHFQVAWMEDNAVPMKEQFLCAANFRTQLAPNNLWVLVPPQFYADGENCGKKVRVKCMGPSAETTTGVCLPPLAHVPNATDACAGCVVVPIVGKCWTCSKNEIVLSRGSFSRIVLGRDVVPGVSIHVEFSLVE